MEYFIFIDDISNFLKLTEFKEFGDGWGDCNGSHLSYFWEGTVQRVLTERNNFSFFEVIWDSQSGGPLIEFIQDFLFDFFPQNVIMEDHIFELVEANGFMSGQLCSGDLQFCLGDLILRVRFCPTNLFQC